MVIYDLCRGHLALVLFLVTYSIAVGQSGDAADSELPQSDDWTQLASDQEIASTLELLAARTRVNYEKLQVWTGAYTVHQQEELSADLRGELFGDRLEKENIDDIMRSEHFVFSFVIDLQENSIYRSKETQTLKWLSMPNGNSVASSRGVKPYDFNSVTTSEHFLQFMPNSRWPAFEDLPDFPEANNKRAAFRNPADKSARQDYGDLPDPRRYFGFDPHVKFWDELELFSRVHSGELGSDSKQLFEKTVDLYKRTGEFGRKYKIRQKLSNPDNTGNLYTESIWDSARGLNPIRFVMASEPDFSAPMKTLVWDWVSIDDIWLPRSYKEEHFSQDASVRYSHAAAILQEKIRLNGPVDPGQFTYAGLGLSRS